MNFLAILQTVSYGSNNGDLSFKPYKNVMVVKSLNPHGFKVELKIKYNALLAVVGKFLNGTGPMLELLAAEVPTVDWASYCGMNVAYQEILEAKGDASTKAMLLFNKFQE